jgi:deazaflavin-dependent oxidoreductase (nitroreductase family)
MNPSHASSIDPMKAALKLFGDVHRSIYLASAGRVGSRLASIPMLLLSTRGRRTGLIRTLPLACLPDPEQADSWVVVASNGGSEKPPAWWSNLQKNDVAMVQLGRESFLVRAKEAPPERRAALWSLLRRRIPPYRLYERVEREIPIVLLRRLRPGEPIHEDGSREKTARARGRTRRLQTSDQFARSARSGRRKGRPAASIEKLHDDLPILR